MKANRKRPACNCINCDRSCYRSDGVSGTTHRATSPDRALAKLAELKQMVEGDRSK